MGLYFVLGMLAAFGLLSILWVLFGGLLPGGKGCAVVFFGTPEPEIFTRFWWLRSLSFLNCPVIVVTENAKQMKNVEICNEEELLPRLRQEYERYHGTGTGDPAGRSQRCGISEL